MALHLGPVRWITYGAVTGQQLGQPAHLAATHGVGLAGEREGTGARAADLATHQVQVADPGHGGAALAALVHPHRPKAERPMAGDPPVGQLAQVGFGDAAHRRRPGRLPAPPEGLQLGETLGAGRHEGPIHTAMLQQQITQATEQGQVGAGRDRQVQIGGIAGGGGARIHHHQTRPFPLAPALKQPLEQHWVALSRVGADQQHHIGQIEVVVAAGRAIGAEAAGIASHCRTHAQARIGIEVVAAQGALEQLVGCVVVLAEELAGAVDRQRLWPLGGQGGLDALHQDGESPLPADWLKGLVGSRTPQGLGEAVGVQGFTHRGALDAHLAQRRGMVAVAAGGPEAAGFGRSLQLQAAAHAAVGALG